MIRFYPIYAILYGVALIAKCEAVDAQDSAPIKVLPSRIELGSLPFGSIDSTSEHTQLVISGMPSQVRIVNVDCSHAPGVRMIREAQGLKGVILDLELNKKQLCEAEPFGAFIKREIRLETNSSIQPQFVVPIVGWLDINTTPRDFSRFVFLGATRWQGIWPTPNVAGAFLAIIILFLAGATGWLWKRSRTFGEKASIVGLFIAAPAICGALLLLGLTYSRGAWLALVLGLAVAAFCCHHLRKVVLLFLTAFIGIILVLPFGIQRIQSYTIVNDDLSIANRLKLWEGALQMMADTPMSGEGAGHFQSAFEQNYQPFDYTAKTSSAVNDYLSFGSEHGLIILSLSLGVLFTLLLLGLRLSLQTQRLTIASLTAALMGILTASTFSTLLVIPEYLWLCAITALVLIACVITFGIREQGYGPFGRDLLVLVSKTTIAALFFLALASTTSLAFLPTRFVAINFASPGGSESSYCMVEPRWKKPLGIILYFADCKHPGPLFHSTIRPLAALGWKVVPVPDSTDRATLHNLIKALHQQSSGVNLFLAGDSTGGRTAWKTAALESSDLVEAGGGFGFLSMDLNSTGTLNQPQQPFLVYQSLYSEGASSNAAICARNQLAFKGLPLTVVLSKDGITHFSAGWMRYLETLSNFFQYVNRHEQPLLSQINER